MMYFCLIDPNFMTGHGPVLSPVLSLLCCPVLSHVVSCHILFCPVMSCPLSRLLSCLLSCHLSCTVLCQMRCPVLSRVLSLVLSTVLSSVLSSVLSHPVHCPVLSCPVLCCPLSCPVACPIMSCPRFCPLSGNPECFLTRVVNLRTAFVLHLKQANGLALNKAHVLCHINTICPMFNANTKVPRTAFKTQINWIRTKPRNS